MKFLLPTDASTPLSKAFNTLMYALAIAASLYAFLTGQPLPCTEPAPCVPVECKCSDLGEKPLDNLMEVKVAPEAEVVDTATED